MTKLLRVSLLVLIALTIFTMAGCRLIDPYDSDATEVALSQSLVIPVVVPSADVDTTGLTKLALRQDVNLSKDLSVQVIINGVSKSMGLPRYWAQHPTIATQTILFFAETIANLGMTDTSAIGTFTFTLQGGEEKPVSAVRFADILVTAAQSLSTAQVVAGVAQAMGVGDAAIPQAQIPNIVATVPRITLTRDADGLMNFIAVKIPIANGGTGAAASLDDSSTTPTTPIALPAPIVVVTYVEALPEKEYEAQLALLAVVKASRAEAGCISYDLYRGNNATITGGGVSTASTGKFVEVQKFRSMADLNAHVASAHVTSLFARATDLFKNGPNQTSPFIAAIMQGDAGPDKTEAGMLRYFGILQTVADSQSLVKTAMLDLVKKTRANEAGIMRYDMFQGAFSTSPTNMIILQNYQNVAALQAHLGATYFSEFMRNTAVPANVAFNEGFFINMISDPTPPAAPVVPDSALTVVSYMIAKPDMEHQARLELIALTAATRKEAGCISYELFQADDTYMTNNPTVIHVGSQTTNFFVLRECWAGNDAVNFHMNTKHFKDFWAKKDLYFVPCAGDNSPFTVTAGAAGLPVQQDKAGKAMGPQLVITTEKQATFDATKQSLFDKIAAARNASTILSYNLFEGGFGSPTNQLVVWERFTQSTTADFYAPVGGFLDSAEGLGLRPEYAASVVLNMIKIRFVNEVDCPSNASLRYDRITMDSIPDVASPKSFPGI